MSQPKECAGGTLKVAGDAALLLELEAVIDPAVNARAIGIAKAVRSRGLPGVLDVVATYRSVAVYFDPLTADPSLIGDELVRASAGRVDGTGGSTIEVPVVYGRDVGPDLLEVASRAGLTAEKVVELHAGTAYRVFMLGFLPGFAYLGSVDDRIATPRHPTPRLRVPAGSVGVAGRQTGIYPMESPGGWQVIGRTSLKPFDLSRPDPFLFHPGDTVRFVPAWDADVLPGAASRSDDPEGVRGEGAPGLVVVSPGLMTLVQDGGRWGYQGMGVSVAGPMDWSAHRLANLAVGNPADAATLEITVIGPELRLERDATLAVAGADLDATLDGSSLSLLVARRVRRGSVLRFGARRAGCRAYVAFDGGIVTTPVLGSRATHTVSRLGGIAGRRLRAGDYLPLGPSETSRAGRAADRPTPAASPGVRLRALPGPQDDAFSPSSLDTLWRSRFLVTPQSDRMGYRLGGARIEGGPGGGMISDATFMGSIQVPPSGCPILLMADRQTTGGYPQIATVITADLPLAGQLTPGDWVEFRPCDRREAISALRAQEGWLAASG